MSPFERAYAWHVPAPLDLEAMRAAASLVEGRQDFAAFQAAGSSTRSSEREVFSSVVLAHHHVSPPSTRIGGRSGCRRTTRPTRPLALQPWHPRRVRGDRRRLPSPHGSQHRRFAGRDRSRPAAGRMDDDDHRGRRPHARGPDRAAARTRAGGRGVCGDCRGISLKSTMEPTRLGSPRAMKNRERRTIWHRGALRSA